MNKNILATVGIVLALALSIFAMTKHTELTPSQKVGAVASPDILSPYFSYGDVRHWAARTASLVQASTTFCNLQSPAATSSLVSASIRFTLASTAAATIEVAKSLTPDATTTLLGTKFAIGASATPEVIASTSASDGTPVVFGPSQWFVVKVMGSGSNAGFAPTGVCQGLWREL